MKKILLGLLLLVPSVGICQYSTSMNSDQAADMIYGQVLYYASTITLSLADGATFNVMLYPNTNTKTAYMAFDISAERSSIAYLYENPVFVSTGTTITTRNLDRVSTIVSTMTVTYAPGTVSSEGTLLSQTYIPASSKPGIMGGISRPYIMWKLKGGNHYLLVIRNISGNTSTCSIEVLWYEKKYSY